MITFFKRGQTKAGRRIVFMARAHASITHRGQTFYIEYNGDRINVTHSVSGWGIASRNFGFKPNDRPEDMERKIRRTLDANWNRMIEKLETYERCAWRH